MTSLEIRDQLPAHFVDRNASELYLDFPNPTLIHLPGIKRPAVFISVLLHGNEDVGLRSFQQVLKELDGRQLPREVMLFIGNPLAAKMGLRKLPSQEDFNRVWPGTDHGESSFRRCMQAVFDYAEEHGVFLNLDLHNNTGTNPLYGCIHRLDAPTLHLATLFSRTMIHFQRPLGVQSAAMARLCPSLTCECGKVGDEVGMQRAAELIHACLHLHHFPTERPPASDFHLLENTATIRIPQGMKISFDNQDLNADLHFDGMFDRWNFQRLAEGTVFCRRRPGSNARLSVIDAIGHDIAYDFFSVAENDFVLRRPIVPSMLTTNVQVIYDDCLGYIMEERSLDDYR